MCDKGAERKLKRLREDEAQVSTTMAFHANRRPLEMVTEFKYLGQVHTESHDDWLTVLTNLRKA